MRFGGNISRTAGFVGMERSALHRKLKQLGVNSEDQGEADGMSRIAYVQRTATCRRPRTCVNVEDRGFQFADGVYEVIQIYAGRFVDDEAPSRPARPAP